MRLILLTSKTTRYDKKATKMYEKVSLDLGLKRKKLIIEGKQGEQLIEKYNLRAVPVFILSEEFTGVDEDDILWIGAPDDYQEFRKVAMRHQGRLQRRYM